MRIAGYPLRWRAGRRNLGSAIASWVVFPFAWFIAFGVLLGTDNLDTNKPLSVSQGVLSGIYFVVCASGFVASIMLPWRWVRRREVAGSDGLLFITGRRPIITPYSAISMVVLDVDTEVPGYTVPGVLLRNGTVLPVRRARVKLHGVPKGTMLLPWGAPNSIEPRGPAATLAQQLVGLIPPPPPGQPQATPIPKRPAFERSATAPAGAVLERTDAEVGAGRALVKASAPTGLTVALFTGLRVAHGTHGWSWPLFVAIAAAVVVLFGLLTLGALRNLPRAVAIGEDWVGIRRYFRRHWVTARAETTIAVLCSVGGRGKFSQPGTTLVLCDREGRGLRLTTRWLTGEFLVQLDRALDASVGWTPLARELVNQGLGRPPSTSVSNPIPAPTAPPQIC